MLTVLGFSVHVKAQNPTTFGVGTDPVGTLHVHSATLIEDNPGISILGLGDTPGGSYKTIFHMTNSSTAKTATDGFSIIQDNAMVTLRQFESAKLRILGYNQQGLTIATNGNVGFGTENPSQRLHVLGNTLMQGTLHVENTLRMGVDNQAFAIGKAHYQDLLYGSSYIGFNAVREGGINGTWTCKSNTWLNGDAVIWATMEGDLLFANIATEHNREQLDRTGITDADIRNSINLKLDHNGLLTAKEIKVTLTDWPDYVFDDSYTMPSLETTEAYIKENGHLPGVPSAEEIEEKGLNLGEMNKILMQKVEELTLQVIELNKQVKELKGE